MRKKNEQKKHRKEEGFSLCIFKKRLSALAIFFSPLSKVGIALQQRINPNSVDQWGVDKQADLHLTFLTSFSLLFDTLEK